MYAIVETGGKQYRVTPGQVIDVDHLGLADGSIVELDKVLLIRDNGRTMLGAPVVPGARVVATTIGEYRAGKIIVFRYKAKVRYRRKTGHRQLYTRLAVERIFVPGTDETPEGTTVTAAEER